MKILLSAYACEPGKGSEPGVGWRWTEGLAGRVNLTVATRANNRPAIEAELAVRPPDDPLHQVSFLYHELPGIFLRLKRTPLLPTMVYYILWQWTLARALRAEAEQADLVHHLTFCTPLCPGFWPDGRVARVIGPVGAPLVNPHYLPLFGSGRLIQTTRGFLMRHLHWLPWLRRAFRNAAAVIPANSEAKALLESMEVRCRPVILDTGTPDFPKPIERPSKPPGHCNFLYAGVLERRKGLELALRAFAKLIMEQESGESVLSTLPLITDDRSRGTSPSSPIHDPQSTILDRYSLTLLGIGPDRKRLESLARNLRISEHVRFSGSVPQADVARHFAVADVFVFTSVRDTSGGVNLEAMANGLPILCIAHQGVDDITDESCAIRVPPSSIPETIHALAAGMLMLANDPGLRFRLGQAARTRALRNFSWQEKFEWMLKIYDQSVASCSSHQTDP